MNYERNCTKIKKKCNTCDRKICPRCGRCYTKYKNRKKDPTAHLSNESPSYKYTEKCGSSICNIIKRIFGEDKYIYKQRNN